VHIHVIAVGKIKERGLRELIDDYAKRIGRYATLRELELKDEGENEVRERIQKALPARARVVALEVLGKPLSSEELARYVGQCEDGAVQHVVFLIGGSYGLPKEVSARADLQLSLGRMTLPHRLARLVLFEQVYRAFTILRGEPYSH
jgi:23S rRNA (pseudouridine1915-N3)-methyltransferase